MAAVLCLNNRIGEIPSQRQHFLTLCLFLVPVQCSKQFLPSLVSSTNVAVPACVTMELCYHRQCWLLDM